MDGERSIHLYDRLTHLSCYNGENEEVFSSEEDGFMNENREFLAAISEGRKPETNELDGLRAQIVLLRGIESIRSGMPQSLTDII